MDLNRTADAIRGVDPIDGARLASAWAHSQAKAVLFEELTAMPEPTVRSEGALSAPVSHRPVARRPVARRPVSRRPASHRPVPARRPRRRSWPVRPRALALAAMAALALLAVTVTPWAPGGSTRAFAVRPLPGGVIEVDWATDFRDGRALEAALRGYGIDIVIDPVPSSPTGVGTVVAFRAGDGRLEAVPGLTFAPDGSRFMIDPMVFQGPLTLQLGVEPRDGEAYRFREEVFEPGEVLGGLHCAAGTPLRAADVASRLPAGIVAEWELALPIDGRDDGVAQMTPVDGVPDGEVLWGYAIDARTVALTVRPDGTVLPEGFEPRLSDVPCTPEQAAAWQ